MLAPNGCPLCRQSMPRACWEPGLGPCPSARGRQRQAVGVILREQQRRLQPQAVCEQGRGSRCRRFTSGALQPVWTSVCCWPATALTPNQPSAVHTLLAPIMLPQGRGHCCWGRGEHALESVRGVRNLLGSVSSQQKLEAMDQCYSSVLFQK